TRHGLLPPHYRSAVCGDASPGLAPECTAFHRWCLLLDRRYCVRQLRVALVCVSFRQATVDASGAMAVALIRPARIQEVRGSTAKLTRVDVRLLTTRASWSLGS